MHPPVCSLALLALAPPAVLLLPRRPAVALLLLGIVAAVAADGVAGAHAAGAGACSAAALALLCRAGVAREPLLAVWLALFLVPLWAPALASRLDAPGPGAPPAWMWGLWPAAPLRGEGWDPLQAPPLYETWGSRAPVPRPGAVLWPLILGSAALASWAVRLYWRARNARSASAGKGP